MAECTRAFCPAVTSIADRVAVVEIVVVKKFHSMELHLYPTRLR